MNDQKKNQPSYAMSGAEAGILVRYLSAFYDHVRLVDASVNYQITIGKDGVAKRSPYRCYCAWMKNERCENCVAARCICGKKRLDKFEFLRDDIYHVLAMYVEVDEQSYALELINKITDETVMCGYGREELVEAITEHNKKLYIDPVAGVYNRRYYEDQLSELHQVEAVAMIDVDDFKKINDSYGHQTGDVALRMIATAIKGCLRKSDAVVRYGGDEFAVVFRKIPKDIFEKKMVEIQASVDSLTIQDCPELKFSLSVGGSYGQGKIADMLREADHNMYHLKRANKVN
jgi:putative two-component system response regulator